MTEQERFLKDIMGENQSNVNPFAAIETPTEQVPEPKPEDTPVVPDESQAKNRRERRLEAKLQAEREAGIQMAARLAALEEARNTQTDTSSEALNAVERIYGVDSPEAREATELLKAALLDVKESAKREALEAYQELSTRENQAVREAETQLDMMLEDIEDEFNVDLTSPESERARTDFFKLMERMSPKDQDGNILYYADHMAVWEDYQQRVKPVVDNTAKDLASRAVSTNSAPASSTLESDVNLRYLIQNGLI